MFFANEFIYASFSFIETCRKEIIALGMLSKMQHLLATQKIANKTQALLKTAVDLLAEEPRAYVVWCDCVCAVYM